MTSVDEGETLGLLYAIRWVKELHNSVTFKPDSKRVVNSYHINSRYEFDLGSYYLIMQIYILIFFHILEG